MMLFRPPFREASDSVQHGVGPAGCRQQACEKLLIMNVPESVPLKG